MIRAVIPKIGIILVVGVVVLGFYFIVFREDGIDSGYNNYQSKSEGFVINIEPRVALPVQVFQNNNKIDTIDSPRKIMDPTLKGEVSLLSEGFLEERVTIGNSGEETDIIFKIDDKSAQNKIIQELEPSGDVNVYLEGGNWVKDARFYLNETWIAGTIVTTNRSGDGEFVVMNKQGQEWVVVYAGTGPSANDFAEINAPRELTEDYYENVQ